MPVKLVFQERPNMGAVYWRVFTKRGNKLRAGEALPETVADWKGSPVEASRLAARVAALRASRALRECHRNNRAGGTVATQTVGAAATHATLAGAT